MALSIAATTFDPAAYGPGQSTGSGSATFSFTSLTSGRGIVVWASGYQGGSLDFTTCTVGSDSLTAVGTTFSAGGFAMRFFYKESLTVSGTQTVTLSYTGGQNGTPIIATGVEITGAGSGLIGTGYATSGANPSSFSWTNGAANSGVIVATEGGSGDGGTCTGYTLFDCANGQSYRRIFYSNDVGGTSQTASPSQGYCGLALEILGGTASTKPAYYYAQL